MTEEKNTKTIGQLIDDLLSKVLNAKIVLEVGNVEGNVSITRKK